MRSIVKDMITLSDEMLLGKAKPKSPQRIGPFTVNTYSFENATMMQRKSKIK